MLCGGSSISGNDLVLEQQKHLLDLMQAPSNEVEAKIALQKRINSAVIAGTSWEGVLPSIRKQADTPWFASFLKFDPAPVIKDVRQPLLVVQGSLDRQVAQYHAERLGEFARARKKGRGVEVVTIPGVNHLFVPATSGEVSEYAMLPDKKITPRWPQAIIDWLAKLPKT